MVQDCFRRPVNAAAPPCGCEPYPSRLQCRSPRLQLAAAFLVLWCFSPGFGAPLYFHMVDTLHFDQQFIGQLAAFTAVGGVVGAWIFGHVLAKRS